VIHPKGNGQPKGKGEGGLVRRVIERLEPVEDWEDYLREAKEIFQEHPTDETLHDLIAEGADGKWEGGADAIHGCFRGLADVVAPEKKRNKKGELVQLPGAGGRSLAFQHVRNPSGIVPSLINALTAIRWLGVGCRYDIFHDKLIIEGIECRISGDALQNLDHQGLKFRQMVCEKKRFDPGSSYTHDALVSEALDHVFDPVRDYLDGLVWDGVPRIDRWLVDYCGAADTPLVRRLDARCC
jgi:hypothetical protein